MANNGLKPNSIQDPNHVNPAQPALDKISPEIRVRIYEYIFNTYRLPDWSGLRGENRLLRHEANGEHYRRTAMQLHELERLRVLMNLTGQTNTSRRTTYKTNAKDRSTNEELA